MAEHIHLSTGYDLDALRTKKRDTFRVAARQLFCYYAKLEGYSLNVIGSFIHIDHVTVLHSVRRVNEIKDTDKIIRDYVDKYEAMSKQTHIIEIVPQKYDNKPEKEELTGFDCPTCSGRGWHWNHERETTKEACSRCGGSGKLKAKVTILWESDK